MDIEIKVWLFDILNAITGPLAPKGGIKKLKVKSSK